MSEDLSWSSVSDDDLKQIMYDIQKLTPGIGQTRMLGALRNRGLKIQKWRVRQCFREIEWLHRDVTSGVLHGYLEQFKQLERYGLLDGSNDVHLFALHFVYKERISRSLQEFNAHWNHDSLSTENSLSPLQLWSQGVLQQSLSRSTAVHGILTDDNTIDVGVMSSAENVEATVVVAETLLGLSDEDIHILQATHSRFGDESISGCLQTVNISCQLLKINC